MKILHLIDAFDPRFKRDEVKLVELLKKRIRQHGNYIKILFRLKIKKSRIQELGERSQTEIIRATGFKNGKI